MELIREEKRIRNEPINRKALEDMKLKYSDENLEHHPEFRARYDKNPALKLIFMAQQDLLKKHANDWKLYSTQGLTVEELRAIRGNLPKFKYVNFHTPELLFNIK
jgi:hypothetical protein